MPEQETIEKAERDKREGKSPSTRVGEFVREEIHHVREESVEGAPRRREAPAAEEGESKDTPRRQPGLEAGG